MIRGGRVIEELQDKRVRYIAIIVPFLLVIYAFCVHFQIIATHHAVSLLSACLLCFWWVVLSVFLLFIEKQSHRSMVLIAASFHLLASAFLIFVSGINSPIAILWILLVIATDLYFSRRAAALSIIWFGLTIAASLALNTSITASVLTTSLTSFIAIILAGSLFMVVSHHQKKRQGVTTAHHRHESIQQDRLDTIINNITDAIITTDKRGVIQLYNAAALNLLDTNDALHGKSVDRIIRLVDQNKQPIIFSKELAASTAAITRDDLSYSFSDGEEIRFEITYSPIKRSYRKNHHTDTSEGYMMIMRDVTKAKSLEEERDEFISVVSHELRTPITIMEGSLSNLMLMQQQKLKVKPEALIESTKVAHDQSLYLAKMVNDLSTLSRAERGVADAGEIIDIKELLHRLHDEYEKDARAKGLHLNLDLGTRLGSVKVSRLYLEELLQNFITNAIKYTQKGSVSIEAEANNRSVTITVTDTGIGISRTDQSKIFQKFYRSEDYRTRETSGTGLGLYVSQKLAHKLHTSIDMKSRLNHGSSFSFSLPLVSTTKEA